MSWSWVYGLELSVQVSKCPFVGADVWVVDDVLGE